MTLSDEIKALVSTLEMQLNGFARAAYEKDLRIADLERQLRNAKFAENLDAEDKAFFASLRAPSAPAVEQVQNESLREGVTILDDMIDSIRRHGNYTKESTLNFLNQLRQCLALPSALPDDAPAWAHRIRERQLAEASAPAIVQQPVHLWHKVGTSDWYFGYPDHSDGGGPYETRTLYTAPQAADTDKVRTHKDVEWLIECAEMAKQNPALAAGIRAKCKAASAAVDTDKVREALKDLYNAVDSCVDLTPEVMRKARSALESTMAAQAPVRKVPGWISVKDRLPGIGVDVVVYCGYMVTAQRTNDQHDPENHKGWVIDFDNGRAAEITHWMPLPAAPVQKGE